jgi:nicotinamidase-related amidase
MEFNKSDTALVVIDPQNDVLSEKGVSWGLVGESVKENNTVENIDRLFKAAKDGIRHTDPILMAMVRSPRTNP